jgi:hypothetical protein
MISSTLVENASAHDLPSPDIETEADENSEASASQRINARRALEENIEILRVGRAL